MSADNLTTQFISDTYRRLLQLSDQGSYITDGTGSVVNLLQTTSSFALTASYVPGVTAINTSSFLINATVSSNVLTFTKGDGSTSNLTVNTGSGGGGGPESDPIFIARSASLATTGSNQFKGNQAITGSLDVSGSFGLYSYGAAEPSSTPNRVGLLYFTDNALYISLD